MELICSASHGNISAICQKAGIGRSTLYRWTRALHDGGQAALVSKQPVKGLHPDTTSSETEALILDISRDNPAWGCKRLSSYLDMLGIAVSSPTIQKVLIRYGRGRLEARLRDETGSLG